jgi:hypothetical protein
VIICRSMKCLLSVPWWHMEGSRGIAPLIFYVGARGRFVVCIKFQPLYPWKRTLKTLNRRLNGPESHSGRVGEEKSRVVSFLLGDSLAPEFYMPMFRNTLSLLHRHLWRWNRQCVPKLQHIKFRCLGITFRMWWKCEINKSHVCGELKQYCMVMWVHFYTVHWLQYFHHLCIYVLIILFRGIVTNLWVG